jgi:hypothetical protein
MKTRTVIKGTMESSKDSMRKPHTELVIKLPKVKKINFKNLIKFLCF